MKQISGCLGMGEVEIREEKKGRITRRARGLLRVLEMVGDGFIGVCISTLSKL